MMKRIGMLRLMTLCLLFLFQNVQAAEKKDTLKVLFIGNSYVYYNNLAHLLTVMSDSMDTKLICTKTTLGGGSLSDPNSRRPASQRVRPEFRNPSSIKTNTDWQDVIPTVRQFRKEYLEEGKAVVNEEEVLTVKQEASTRPFHRLNC